MVGSFQGRANVVDVTVSRSWTGSLKTLEDTRRSIWRKTEIFPPTCRDPENDQIELNYGGGSPLKFC